MVVREEGQGKATNQRRSERGSQERIKDGKTRTWSSRKSLSLWLSPCGCSNGCMMHERGRGLKSAGGGGSDPQTIARASVYSLRERRQPTAYSGNSTHHDRPRQSRRRPARPARRDCAWTTMCARDGHRCSIVSLGRRRSLHPPHRRRTSPLVRPRPRLRMWTARRRRPPILRFHLPGCLVEGLREELCSVSRCY